MVVIPWWKFSRVNWVFFTGILAYSHAGIFGCLVYGLASFYFEILKPIMLLLLTFAQIWFYNQSINNNNNNNNNGNIFSNIGLHACSHDFCQFCCHFFCWLFEK